MEQFLCVGRIQPSPERGKRLNPTESVEVLSYRSIIISPHTLVFLWAIVN